MFFFFRFPKSKGVAGHVATTGETLNITDAYHDERFNRYTGLELYFCLWDVTTRENRQMPGKYVITDSSEKIGNLKFVRVCHLKNRESIQNFPDDLNSHKVFFKQPHYFGCSPPIFILMHYDLKAVLEPFD